MKFFHSPNHLRHSIINLVLKREFLFNFCARFDIQPWLYIPNDLADLPLSGKFNY